MSYTQTSSWKNCKSLDNDLNLAPSLHPNRTLQPPAIISWTWAFQETNSKSLSIAGEKKRCKCNAVTDKFCKRWIYSTFLPIITCQLNEIIWDHIKKSPLLSLINSNVFDSIIIYMTYSTLVNVGNVSTNVLEIQSF